MSGRPGTTTTDPMDLARFSIVAEARAVLTETRGTLAAARAGVGQMDVSVSGARWALSQITNEPSGRLAQDALDRLVSSCEDGAKTGRVVARQIRRATEDVEAVGVKASVSSPRTPQDLVDHATLRTRLDTIMEDLVHAYPLVEQVVVRLGWAADYARQVARAPERGAASLLVDRVDRRLSGVAGAGARLRGALDRARVDTDNAWGQVDAFSSVARVRMDSHRDHSPTAGVPSPPGVGR